MTAAERADLRQRTTVGSVLFDTPTVRSLLDALEASERDAQRYRWIRARANVDYPVRHGAPGISINMPEGGNACHYPVHSDLDAAIDAARTGEPTT